jgi:hypothetical protein
MIYTWHKPPQDIEHVNLHIKLHIQEDNVIINTTCTWPLTLQLIIINKTQNYHRLLLTYLRSWAVLEKPPIVQSLKNFPAFYGTQRFNTVFTRALHWSLSWAIAIQSAPSHPIYLISISKKTTHWGNGNATRGKTEKLIFLATKHATLPTSALPRCVLTVLTSAVL